MPKLLRTLSQAFLTTLLCTLLIRNLAAQTLKDRHGKPLQIGLQLYSVRADCAKDLPGVLSAVAKMGYTGVEFAGYHGRSAEELRQMLKANNLKCYGTHLDLNALLGDNFDKTVEFCRVLGCKFLVVPWLPEERRNSKQTTVETAHLFGEIAKKLQPHGMVLGWHNEDYEFKPVDGATIWETFWANADKSVAMEFDIGNAMSAGVQAAPYLMEFDTGKVMSEGVRATGYLLRYPAHLLAVHVKDHSATNPNALLGEGDENWNEVIPLLKHNPAIKYFIIEQESYGQPPLVCVEKCLRNFEKLWNAK